MPNLTDEEIALLKHTGDARGSKPNRCEARRNNGY
jgi:hypothetical protein